MVSADRLVVTVLLLASARPRVRARSQSIMRRTTGPEGRMTYSIVARDPETGELGVAVQSHWPFVGSGVGWAQSGVGAVATQSLIEISYGPLGLELMRDGKSPAEAL